MFCFMRECNKFSKTVYLLKHFLSILIEVYWTVVCWLNTRIINSWILHHPCVQGGCQQQFSSSVLRLLYLSLLLGFLVFTLWQVQTLLTKILQILYWRFSREPRMTTTTTKNKKHAHHWYGKHNSEHSNNSSLTKFILKV